MFKPGPVTPEVDKAVSLLLAAPQVKKVMDDIKADHERSLADLKGTLDRFRNTAPGASGERQALALLIQRDAAALDLGAENLKLKGQHGLKSLI